MKIILKRYSVIILIQLLFTLIPSYAFSVAEIDIIFKESIYTKTYKDYSFNVSPNHFNFIVNHFTDIMNIIMQSDPPALKTILGPRFEYYRISGDPDNFKIKSGTSEAIVKVSRTAEDDIIYYVVAETRRFKIPISGELTIKLQLHYDDPNQKGFNVDIAVAFATQSEFMAAAMKPIQKLFSAELDKFSDKIINSSTNFFEFLQEKIPIYLNDENLLAQASLLYQKNQNLTKELETLKSSKLNGHFQPDKISWSWSFILLMVVALFICAVVGGIIGFLAADQTRLTRSHRLGKLIHAKLGSRKKMDEKLVEMFGEYVKTRIITKDVAKKILKVDETRNTKFHRLGKLISNNLEHQQKMDEKILETIREYMRDRIITEDVADTINKALLK